MSYIYNLTQLENRLISAYAVIDDYCDDFLLRRSEVASFIRAGGELRRKFLNDTSIGDSFDDDPNVIRKILRDQLFDYLTQIDLMRLKRDDNSEALALALSQFLAAAPDSRQLT